MYQGFCVGGPIAGQKWVSRFPKGFLLVDKPNNKCWIYDWNTTYEEFVARWDEGQEVHTEGPDNRRRAAEEFDYDVLAAPWEGVS
jgi:hypothetical protein